MNIKIFAGIVTFNPDIKKLKANIEAVCTQVEEVLIDDNGSKNIDEVRKLVMLYENVYLIENNVNLGIATALNILFKNAEKEGAEWLLTLDQDSCLDKGFISEMKPYMIDKTKNSLTMLRRDRNIVTEIDFDKNQQLQTVDWCMTSGNLVRVKVWKKVGGFNEDLFIDNVDEEFCYRIRKFGYKIHQINKVLMTHEVGNSRMAKFLWREVIVTNYSAFRKYYIYRNTIYMMKYNLSVSKFIRVKHLVVLTVEILLYEDHKLKSIQAALKGVWDGIRMPEYEYPDTDKEN